MLNAALKGCIFEKSEKTQHKIEGVRVNKRGSMKGRKLKDLGINTFAVGLSTIF